MMQFAGLLEAMKSADVWFAAKNEAIFRRFVGDTAWFMISALATLALAWKTWQLAKATTEMALETRDLVTASAVERAQVERHHQQGMMPLLTIEADCLASNVQSDKLRLYGKLRNLGGGPSTKATIYVKPDTLKSAQFNVRPMPGPAEWDIDVIWEAGNVGNLPRPYECLICFASIFGTRGAIELKSHSGLRGDVVVENLLLPGDSLEPEIDSLEQRYRSSRPVLAGGEVGAR